MKRFTPRKIIFLLLALLSFASAPLFAVDKTLQDEFTQANEAYFNRDFPKAIQLYSDLEKRGMVSGDLFYNLGNTYYRSGQIGWAIYYYLKALRYHPRDRDLVANYKYVLGKRVDQIETPLWIKVYRTLFFWVEGATLKELLIVTLVLYWLFFLLLILRILKKKFALTLALLAVSAFNLALLPTAVAKYYEEKVQVTGVVVSPVAPVFSEPAKGAIKLFELHEGAVATVTDEANDFVKLRLPDGKRGWVGAGDVRQIR
ncbi:MAG: tetratricopeptide repeat protein [bacterium]